MKRFLTWGSALLIFLALIYGTIWIYSYQWLIKEIDRVYAESAENGYEFLGEKPVLTGFPFIPEIYYSGGFKVGNIALTFPEARLRGYPIPGLTFNLDVPHGITLDGYAKPGLWSLDTLKAKIVIPSTIPADYTEKTLQAWQQSGGEFNVRSYTLTKGALQSEGAGVFALDTNLQPAIHFDSNLKGYEDFIQTLLQQGMIEPFPAMAATGVLNSLAKPDEATGENTVTLAISVQNQMLTVGPLQVVRLPEILWGIRSLPDPRQ